MKDGETREVEFVNGKIVKKNEEIKESQKNKSLTLKDWIMIYLYLTFNLNNFFFLTKIYYYVYLFNN